MPTMAIGSREEAELSLELSMRACLRIASSAAFNRAR